MTQNELPHATRTLVFFVNGRKVEDASVDPEWTLLYYLRNKLRLCGTKLGCGEGGCGACTVMVSHFDRTTNQVVHRSVNACLAPVAAMHGRAVTTVEGIGSTKTKLHAVQKRIAESHGSQCGFCTPGIVMSMYTLLRNLPKPTMEDIDTALQGNLCRCTGYRPILEGFQAFTEDWERRQANINGNANGCAMGDKCCRLNGDIQNENALEEEAELYKKNEFVPYDPTQEPIFPPALKLSSQLNDDLLVLEGKRVVWYRPTSLDQLMTLKTQYPGLASRIVVGNSEVGVEVKNRKMTYPVLIHPNQIPELVCINKTDTGVRVGASVTLTDLQDFLQEEVNTQPEHRTRVFLAIVKILHWFAGKQIRNVSAVGGNLMTSSPISDLNQIYLAAGCEIEVQSKEKGARKIKMDRKFFTGYRRNIVLPDEVLVAIHIPFTDVNQYFHAYKQAKRRDDDIAIVNIAVNAEFEPHTNIVKDIAVAFGGMAATTILSSRISSLVGRKWNDETLQLAYTSLVEDLPLPPDAPGGMYRYRKSLALSLFFKAYLAISQQLGIKLPDSYHSAPEGFHTKPPQSSQYCKVTPMGENDRIGQPIVHRSAMKQATGEAVYCDDMPHLENELYLALVLSTRAHANIKSIDASDALKLDGVEAFYSSKDIAEERNRYGIIKDEEVFASGKVTCQGQIIGAIIAKDQATAQQAAKAVKIEYEELEPIIITIEDAIKQKSFFPGYPKKLIWGDVDKAFAEADHIICGEARMGGQEHFYLETQCTLAVPKGEDDEMEIFCSTQNPTELQKCIAEILDVQNNKIVCRTKRLGGGFGGKETKFLGVALPVAFSAHRLNRPVRCMLDRDEDMMITGARHPFLGKYKVAFSKDGKIVGCEMFIYNNGGNTIDLSAAVLQRAMFHFENSYSIPNVRVHGYVCKTNIPSNTAFRGFGGPQGMFFAEIMIRDISSYLKKDVIQVSAINLYKEGDTTHYSQVLHNCTLQKCWDECLQRADYHTRKNAVDLFNRQNKWKKRGISVVPTKFGIAFTLKFLNQAGALVLVYEDGSVLLSHSGTEMGQGLHTKMIQVASRVLGIHHKFIHISETATDKIPNTSPTAASAGSDLNGMAVMIACQKIVDRLEPFKAANPKGVWKDWVQDAYHNRVSLSATGFYGTPNIGHDWDKNEGDPFNYFTYGVACSEVEIDCLTGDHKVLRTDIVMDLGESLNPAIDVGQVEGGFMQGYGLFTLEELLFSSKGALFTRGPGWYKIPGFADIPTEFNVSLLKGVSNPRAVYSSKAVGEPPLFLASSIFFAIKEGIKAARKDGGQSESFNLEAPATAERIRLAIADDIVQKFPEAEQGTYVPYFVRA